MTAFVKNPRQSGFSLIELLIAMSLFMVLGTALITLLTRAFDFLDTGTQGTEVLDKAGDFLSPFTADVMATVAERNLEPGMPSVRFLSDVVPFDSDGDGDVDYRAQRLAFVRSTSSETADAISRRAGTKPGGTAFLDGKNDLKEAEAGKLKAPGGMQEVLYIAIPDDLDEVVLADGTVLFGRIKNPYDTDEPMKIMTSGGLQIVERNKVKAVKARDPGLLTIYRATRSPVGGKGSLLDPDTIKTTDDVRRVGHPLLTGVLHFGVRFWTAQTKTWGDDLDLHSATGPALSWDSTRGILPKGTRRGQFSYAKGPDSLEDPSDDVSPRRLRVTFVFARTGRDTEMGFLTGDLNESSSGGDVSTTNFDGSAADQFIKVGTEWIRFSGRTASRYSGLQRGRRGTEPRAHPSGEPVRYGFGVERTIEIPAHREDFNSNYE